MSKIERGTFSEFLRRYLQMKGASDVVDELAPEIAPGLVLEQERPEWEYIKGARLMAWTGAYVAAGAAGTASKARLRNPATSSVVAIITRLEIGNGIAGGPAVEMFVTLNVNEPNNMATTSGTVPRDCRTRPFGSALVASSEQTNTAVGGSAIWRGRQAADRMIYTPYDQGWAIVTPGGALNWGGPADQGLIWTIWWLEKRIDDLELS